MKHAAHFQSEIARRAQGRTGSHTTRAERNLNNLRLSETTKTQTQHTQNPKFTVEPKQFFQIFCLYDVIVSKRGVMSQLSHQYFFLAPAFNLTDFNTDIFTLYDVIIAKTPKNLKQQLCLGHLAKDYFLRRRITQKTLSFPSSNQSDTSILQIINYNGKHVLYLGRQVGRDLHSMMDYPLFLEV